MQTSVGALISQAAWRFASKTALVFEDQKWSFRELDELSSKLAAGLQALGVGTGATVALYSHNCPEWIIAYYAIMKVGAVVTPLNLMLTPEEAAYAMNDCGAVAVFGSDDRIAALERARTSTSLRHCVAYG